MRQDEGSAATTASATGDAVRAFRDTVAGSGCRSLAIVGLVKNAGKTTVVNALLAGGGRTFGLTSLGLDGERTDNLTGLAKPRIEPPAGTLLATTRGSLARSRYALDVVEELPFLTPLGRVVIGRAGGQGAVEVSGPTTLAELRTTVERLQALGAPLVLVDGAIDRLGSASPRVSDGLVLATGGMVGDSLDDVLATTRGALDLLQLPATDEAARELVAGQALAGARAVAFTEDDGAHPLELRTVVGEGVAVAREMTRLGACTLYVGGALTREFAEDFTRVLPPRSDVRVIVRDPTVLVMPPAAAGMFLRRGIRVEVLTPLRLLALTVNPFRVPQPYMPARFFAAVAEAVGDRVPLFDVVNGFTHAPPDRHSRLDDARSV